MQTSPPPLRQRPNRLHSLLFCLLLGVLSIIAAEVVSGSNRFPFVGPSGINVMGWLITYPVYLLHTVFLAGLMARATEPLGAPYFSRVPSSRSMSATS